MNAIHIHFHFLYKTYITCQSPSLTPIVVDHMLHFAVANEVLDLGSAQEMHRAEVQTYRAVFCLNDTTFLQNTYFNQQILWRLYK
jgi:hypothetical protein